VCFESFKGVPKHPPNNKAMAGSPNGQAVCRYIKGLPSTYTNLCEPKGMYLEDLVRTVERNKQTARQPGAPGYEALLTATLQVGTGRLLGRSP
jgi:hypothetical protein